MFIPVVIALLSTALGVQSNPVVNGENAKENEFPFIVSLRKVDDNFHFCGGSIITNRHVITAAHCFDEVNTKDNTIIVAGTNSKSEKPFVFHIKELSDYSKWSKKKPGHHDVLIVTLKEQINFAVSSNLQRVALPTHPPVDGTRATIVGWGDTNKKVEPDSLQKVYTRILSVEECKELHEDEDYNPPYKICAFSSPISGACNGDSGGPLVYEGVLIGIVGTADEICADGASDVFANVYMYWDFINSLL